METTTIQKTSFARWETLKEQLKVDPTAEIQTPPTILSIKNDANEYLPIATAGNFSVLIGKAKSRKTFLLTSFIASSVNRRSNLQNIIGTNEGKKVVLFDTEQSPYHLHRTIKTITKQIGQDQHPDFEAYGLRTLSPAERISFIEWFIANTENIGIIFIDGIRDLLSNGINDEAEATELTSKLLKWTGEYEMHIMLVLHTNKNDNNARGHIGTEVVNKSETVLSVTKNQQNADISDVIPEYSRNIDFDPFSFIIDDEIMPALVDTSPATSRKFNTDQEISTNMGHVLNNNKGLFYNDLVNEYVELSGKAEPTAKKHIRRAVTEGWIIKTQAGNYKLSHFEGEKREEIPY